MTTSDSWFALLRAEVDRTSVRAAARRIGYSPATVSLVLGGSYAGSTGRVAEAVMTRLARHACPYTGEDMQQEDCTRLACAPAPTHNPTRIAHWRACQHCRFKPEHQGESA
ncbi:XRE family transcriptional regulator [Laribacter hongkongensis]|uniref:XRE family transcriptional regulator n=1 Tax=Laribacter hongkongensis TaxID=168471 RepID=A0ABD4SV57_9NEIS|nr:XRE family transcriptional regulator [Laribacter hongkongensis]MCG9026519.1 XRE family transcriptional regulator [Laribacter hongkongensis]MCG9059449.1 XRE family transcriptional regulator [Laribacter hongkongensis]MCG9087395.1 XRE family transcriptional regulator [Laribacter hongkongensis]